MTLSTRSVPCFAFLLLCALGSPWRTTAQSTNLWSGPTGVANAGSWTNEANWSPEVPDTATEVASLTADFTVNTSVTLDGTTTVNGVIFNDTAGSPRQTIMLLSGNPPGQLLFAGSAPFVDVVNATEAQPVTLSAVVDFTTFTKRGNGWLRLANLANSELPATLAVLGGALLLDQNGSNLVVTPGGFIKSGNGQFVVQNTMPLTGSGTFTVDAGRAEIRKGSTNFTGALIVNSNGQFVARQTYSHHFGDTNGATTVNGTGQAKFQDPTAFICDEPWILNGFRTDGSLQMDYADATLTGPIIITTNTHININTFNHSIRHTRIQGVIDDGVATAGVTFTIGYGGASPGADQQYTNLYTASRFILSGSNTYGGATYISTRGGSTNVPNQVLTVELTNGHNRLPATTTLTLGGIPPGVGGNAGMSGRLVLDGVNQELAGLASSGTGTLNRVSSSTPDLCSLTISSTTTNTFNGIIGGPLPDESNIEVTKRGAGYQVFGGANTYTGLTVISAGILEASNSFALGSAAAGTTVSNGAQLRVSGGSVIGDELLLVGSGTSGNNLGALRSIHGTNTINGSVHFAGGVEGRIQQTSHTLIFNGGVTSTNLNVMFASFSGTTTIINSNPVNVGTAIVKAHDPGITWLNAAGNVMGQLNPAWGNTVFIGASNALPTNVVLRIGESSLVTAGTGTFDLNGYDVTCGQLLSSYNAATTTPHNIVIRNSNAVPATLTVNQTNNTSYEGRITGNLSLTKDGSGRLTLTGTNTFANTTTVATGTLALAGSGSLASSSIVLNAGALLLVTGRVDGTLALATNQTLSGNGSVLGTVANGGTVAPGSTTGTITIGTLLQTAGGVLAIEIGGAGAGEFDTVEVTDATLGGTLAVALVDGYAPSLNDAFVILNAGGTIAGEFAATNLPSLGPGLEWTVQYLENATLLWVVSAPPPAGYTGYAQQIVQETQRGYQDDPDSDGYANLLEYVTGGLPTTPDTHARMRGTRMGGTLALQFSRDTSAVDATLIVEGSSSATNDADWTGIATNLGGSWGSATNVSEIGSAPAQVTVFDIVPGASNRFLRLRVTRP